MSLKAIRALYQPESHFMVRQQKHKPNVSFREWTQAGRVYVISGQCTFDGKSGVEGTWNLTEGDIVDLPTGDYDFSVADAPVELIRVWALPERILVKDDAPQKT